MVNCYTFTSNIYFLYTASEATTRNINFCQEIPLELCAR
jgi:hypothetical protein